MSSEMFTRLAKLLDAARQNAASMDSKLAVLVNNMDEHMQSIRRMEALLAQYTASLAREQLQQAQAAKDDALLKELAKPDPTMQAGPPPDPLLSPPSFVAPYKSRPAHVLQVDGPHRFHVIGMVDGHRIYLVLLTNPNHLDRISARLHWGCRCIDNEAQARAHWVRDSFGNTFSTQSRERRPHAIELIDYIKAVCRYHGWAW